MWSLLGHFVASEDASPASKGKNGQWWAFMVIVLLMSIHRLAGMRFWSNLHLVDNRTLSPSDGLSAKIRPVLDVLGETFLTS